MGNRICIFGASITHGFYDTEKGGWADRIKQQIAFKDKTSLFNLGISGDTTDDLLIRVAVELKARQPGAVVFALGNNDSAFDKKVKKNQVPIEQFEDNVHRLIEIARQFTKDITYVGLMPIDERRVNPWLGHLLYLIDTLKEYDNKIEAVCRKEKIQYIKLFNELNTSEYLNNLHDGLHPNAKGHEMIFNILKDQLKSII
ncbi:MAG: GDSL-type esterase/lipase family protein [Patescibacteria group bacterium]